MQISKKWDWEFGADAGPIKQSLKEILKLKDLIFALVRKELTASYQQSLLGYTWLFFQPLLTTLFYFIVFSRIVRIDTMGIPPLLFYMSGSILWSYFSDCLMGSMYTFAHQSHIFQKIYFPRLVFPIAIVINHSIRFAIQFSFFLFVYLGWFILYGGLTVSWSLIFLPFIFIQIVLFGMGLGMIISVYMSKYKDLEFFVQFFIRLFMFITPVIYPASMVPNEFKIVYWLNPLTVLFELFRSIFFTHQTFDFMQIIPGAIISLLIFLFGVFLFHKKEKIIMDTI
jgi:lipopolysaccharide transport system permease protein